MRLSGFIAASLIGLPFGVAPAQAQDTVKVFLLAGQSNMQGHGRTEEQSGGSETTGTLRDYLNNDPATYGHLAQPNGQWVQRDDVWVWARQGGVPNPASDTIRKGNLTPGFGASTSQFGPELGFGQVVGDFYDEQVVLVKTAWGGASLYGDLRPPSSGNPSDPTDQNYQGGFYYQRMLDAYDAALVDIAAQFPGQDIELTGFAWHQGFNDRLRNNNFSEADQPFRRYEENMANFIRDVRDDLNAPDLPFVIATTSMGGDSVMDSPGDVGIRSRTLQDAQLAMADPAQYPEFAGTVGAVNTRDYWRVAGESPRNQGFHWNQNAETYYFIGDSLGEAMVEIVPEPSSAILFGIAGLFIARRRRHD